MDEDGERASAAVPTTGRTRRRRARHPRAARPSVGTLGTVAPARRWSAIGALACSAASVLLLAVGVIRQFPRGPLLVLALCAATALGLDGSRRRGVPRSVESGLALLLALGVLVTVVATRSGPELAFAALTIAVGTVLARRAFAARAELPPAPRPARPVVVWNPRSGGGKAATAHLDREAATRGIEAVELRPGDDLVELVEAAVARGADALGAAGGDGTQALVATIASREGIPFVCIPAGTRNHFALDLGVDRDDVVGALDAFLDGRERRVDLAEVNGRVFVNNASMGVYAEAVQHAGYRDAKLTTLLDTVPDVLGGDSTSATELRWATPDGDTGGPTAVLLVSNNPYRLGTLVGNGTRPRLDAGALGIVAARAGGSGDGATAAAGVPRVRRWESPTFRVDADRPVPIGVDGEALVIDPPLQFRVRAAALRVLIAQRHRGASPSADAPVGSIAAVAALARIALGRPGVAGGSTR